MFGGGWGGARSAHARTHTLDDPRTRGHHAQPPPCRALAPCWRKQGSTPPTLQICTRAPQRPPRPTPRRCLSPPPPEPPSAPLVPGWRWGCPAPSTPAQTRAPPARGCARAPPAAPSPPHSLRVWRTCGVCVWVNAVVCVGGRVRWGGCVTRWAGALPTSLHARTCHLGPPPTPAQPPARARACEGRQPKALGAKVEQRGQQRDAAGLRPRVRGGVEPPSLALHQLRRHHHHPAPCRSSGLHPRRCVLCAQRWRWW